ncbi:MAG: ABC transporter permease [Cyclobacteriaceae bacterium]|nr:ABC transporter permease [Cyclobacteriaceae bacterium]
MISNLIKVAFRNFYREKFYTFLNVSGLAVGIAVSLIITIYILNELSYDRYHSKADRIYRLVSHLEMGSNVFDGNAAFPPLAAAVKNQIPEVEYAVRQSQPHNLLLKVNDIAFYEKNIYFVDPDYFKVFDFKLIIGDPTTALNNKYQVVLTRALAEKYFQSSDWQAIMGKPIQMGEDVYQVTGIVEDTPPNTHFHYAALASMESTIIGRDLEWSSTNVSTNVSTYLLLKKGASIEDVIAKIPKVIENHNPGFKDLPNQGIILNFKSQALTDIHLYSNVQGDFEPNSDINTIYLFGIVALVVLALASVNFINLTTARSANRAKEVGVRKVLGSCSGQLIRQFTLESIIVTAVATLIALGLIELVRVPFATLTGRELSFGLLLEPIGISSMVLLVVLLGVLAGSYPALFMSRLKPSLVLKGDTRSGFKSSKLRNNLVTFQFTISIVLITSTLIVQRQLEFMRSKKLGFYKENLLVVKNGDRLDSYQSFHDELDQLSSVQSVGSSRWRLFSGFDGTVAVTEDDRDTRRLLSTLNVDYDYISTLEFEMVEGRNFSRDFKSDSSGVILNEVAASYLFEGEALGKKIYLNNDTVSKVFTVIGMIKNFNFQSLKSEVTPLVFILGKDEPTIYIRFNPGNYAESIAQIESIWSKHADVAFDFSFFDEEYNNLFKEETKLSSIFSLFTGLALFIACLGLLGLAAYLSEQRSKELSIRKVLGATLPQIVVLLSRDFVRLIILASLLAFPIAYYIMNIWLETYAYRVPLRATLFISSGVLVMLVALLSVSYQSIKAALVNPVESLKNE